MRMKWGAWMVGWAMASTASMCLAQYASPEDSQAQTQAEDNLKTKLTQEAAAATQPSGLTNADVERIDKAMKELVAENTRLRAIIIDLEQRLQANQPANQAAQNNAPNFSGSTEPRVGMSYEDLKRLPNVKIEIISENSEGTLYRVSTGSVDDYGQRVIEDLPSHVMGPMSHTESVVVGSHPAKIERVMMDRTTGKVSDVEPDNDQ